MRTPYTLRNVDLYEEPYGSDQSETFFCCYIIELVDMCIVTVQILTRSSIRTDTRSQYTFVDVDITDSLAGLVRPAGVANTSKN